MNNNNIKKIIGIIIIIGIGIEASIILDKPEDATILMVDYGYIIKENAPLVFSPNKAIMLNLTNTGAYEHEFVIIKDKEEPFEHTKELAQYLGWAFVEEQYYGLTGEDTALKLRERIATMYEEAVITFNREHWSSYEERIYVKSPQLEAGTSILLEFKIEEPGEYWFVCRNIGGSYPQIHQERGMIGKILIK